MYSRRDFGRIALWALWAGAGAELRSSPQIHSVVAGVKLGAISYSFRALPRTEGTDYIDTIVNAFVECGIGYCELFNPMVEPFTLPGGGRAPLNTPELKKAREDLRAWRLSAPLSRFKDVRKKFDDAGVDVFAYVMTFTDDFTDDEIDAIFKQAQALGVKLIGTNQTTVGMGPRLVPFCDRYKIDLAFHCHSKVSDPNEVASVASYEKVFSMSKRFKANLDIGHFTAGNNDAVAFLQKYHERITHLHLKDRKRNDGPNMPWGEGETPIKPVLSLLKEKHYPIYAVIEYEYQGKGTPIEEVKKCMDFMRSALA
jgi:sugar phosphate isomerase/epimerase